MEKVISVRINDKLEEIIKRHSEERKEEQSDVIRDLINTGSLYLAIKGYTKGEYSIGKAAYLANLPLSEFMDLIMDIGIKSNISKEDLLEGCEDLENMSDILINSEPIEKSLEFQRKIKNDWK